MAGETILVVEDEQIVARDLQNRLKRIGYEVPVTVDSGAAAIQQTGARRPDLVLMDVMLKGDMLGTEAADEIRRQFNIPVVYLTAYSDRTTLEQAKISEPFGFVIKPFEERELQTTLEMALYRHQMEQERDRLKEQLVQAQKLEAVGHLTAGVSHNFNNALNVIMGNIDLALMVAPDNLKRYLEKAKQASRDAADIVDGLLMFCRERAMAKEPFNLSEMAQQVVQLSQPAFDRKVEIAVEGVDERYMVYGDAVQLKQAILNMCINARDAMAELPEDIDRVPRLVLRVEGVDAQPQEDKNATPEPHVKLSIMDNGIGMDEAAMQHLFEPFFTTKAVDKGTGLGLASAYGIVKEHAGWITCDSQPGEGAAFHIYLPLTETEARPKAPEATSEIPGGSETILIVEDEDLVRETAKEILEIYGYQVLTGVDGEDGLSVYRQNRGQINLVLLDLSMPKMSGTEVLRKIRAEDPKADVIVMTGYAAEDMETGGARVVLKKPLTPRPLLNAIRSVLDAASSEVKI